MPARPQDDELDELVCRYLERVESGSPSDAAIASVADGSPERETELRASITALRAIGLLDDDDAPVDAFPDDIAGFRLVRRLGAGGMGVVFLAEGPEGARVALKLVRPEQLYFERARARFQREVELAGRLDHPGIAGVVASGEQDGVPFLAQQWIPGAPLDRVLAAVGDRATEDLDASDLERALESTLPPEARGLSPPDDAFTGTWEAAVLRIVRQVATALDHAHAQGVVHRDVKPSNVVLRPDGRAVLIDFGLASIADATSLTRTGAQIGSLPYMSPEQLDGDARAVDGRTDVYALGVAMYELLTLQPPYRSQSSERMRHLILDACPVPPRRMNARIGAGAEVVCLRAMERDPRRRYATAGDFARDVHALLEGRPIIARPPGVVRRTGRWIRRRPVRAAVLALLVGGPLGWAAVAQWAYLETDRAYRAEQSAHARADRHFSTAIGSIRSLFTEFADETLPAVPRMQRARLDAVERALGILDGLEKERPGDARLREERAFLMRERGDALTELGRFVEARDAYEAHRASIASLLETAEEPAHRVSHRVTHRVTHRAALERQLAISTERSAALVSKIVGPAAALAPYEDAVERLRALVDLDPCSTDARDRLALALKNQAQFLRLAGQPEDAFVAAQEGVEIASARSAETPHSAAALRNESSLRARRLDVLDQLGTTDDALDEIAERVEMVELLQRARAVAPDDRRVIEDLSAAWSGLAAAHFERRDYAAALSASDRSLEHARRLAAEFPSVERLERHLMECLVQRATLLAFAGEIEAALADQTENARRAESLFARGPGDVDRGILATTALGNLAGIQIYWIEDHGAARETLVRAEAALDATRAIDADHPEVAALDGKLAYSEALCAIALADVDAALVAIETYEERATPGDETLFLLADLWAELADRLRRTDAELPELEDEARARCLDLLEASVREGPHVDARRLRASNVLPGVVGDDPRWTALLSELDRRDS